MSRARVRLTEAARRDLDEAVDFLFEESPEAAEHLLDLVEVALARLADHPEIGHLRPDLGLARDEVRFWTIERYWIAYWIREGEVQVLRILHGARDAVRELR